MTASTKPAYSYDPLTRIFIGETVADADPLVEENWLFPAHTTGTAVPSAPDGQVQIHDAATDTWSLIRSWLSTPLFQTSTGEQYQIGTAVASGSFNGLGDLPDWLTADARPSALHVWKDGAWVVDPQFQQAAELLAAQEQCAQLMARASLITSGLSDAFIAGILSEADQARYKAWAAYKLALTKVSQQSGYPANIAWPTLPE